MTSGFETILILQKAKEEEDAGKDLVATCVPHTPPSLGGLYTNLKPSTLSLYTKPSQDWHHKVPVWALASSLSDLVLKNFIPNEGNETTEECPVATS